MGLELNIFILGWGMIAQKFSSHSCPYKSYETTSNIVTILIFDVIVDEVH